MTLKVQTAAHGVVLVQADNAKGVVRLLRELALGGVKCISWEVVA